VTDAVQKLPELSMLAANLEGTSLATDLGDASFVGTVFVPTNTALKAISDKVRAHLRRGRGAGLAGAGSR
jgi:hypothetical protein